MTAHTLFEQTNTFRDALRRLGFHAESYDLPGTAADHGCDLMEAIASKCLGKPSILDRIQPGDLVFAFFPCTYFSMGGLVNWAMTGKVKRKGNGKPIPQEYIDERRRNRAFCLMRFKHLLAIDEYEGWRLVVENPASSLTRSGLDPLPPPTFTIRDRSAWGDLYAKPTAFWLRNLELPASLPPFDEVAAAQSRMLRDHIRGANSRRNAARAERKTAGGITNGKIDSIAKWEQTPVSGAHRAIATTTGDYLSDLREKAAAIADPATRRMLVRSYIHPRFAQTFCAWLINSNT